jgi:hypothetical protein
MTEARSDTNDFAGRINALIDALECRICDSGSDYEAVCRLRYAAYLAESAIDPNDRHTLSDDFDHSPNALVFGIHLGGILAASIRIHLVSQRDPASPALAAFPDHLQGILLQGRSFIDPSRFVVDAGMAKAWAGLHLCTLRLPFIAAGYLGAHVVTATVRREHEAFYRRVLNCSPVCAPRTYPTLLKPLGLMTVDYREQAPRVLARYPFFGLRGGAEEALFAKLAGRSQPFDGDAQ